MTAIWDFLRVRKRYWLLPPIVVFCIFCAMLVARDTVLFTMMHERSEPPFF